MRPPSRRRGHGTPREISAGRDEEEDDGVERRSRPSSSSDDKDADTTTIERGKSRRLCRSRGDLRAQTAQAGDEAHLARLSREKHRGPEGAAAAEEQGRGSILFEVFFFCRVLLCCRRARFEGFDEESARSSRATSTLSLQKSIDRQGEREREREGELLPTLAVCYQSCLPRRTRPFMASTCSTRGPCPTRRGRT